MSELSTKTVSANPAMIKRTWWLLDAKDQIVGRLSSRVAAVLRGKNKPYFTPHLDCGDYVIIINADKARFTGNKWTDKKYISHTGYPGGQRSINPKDLIKKHPGAVIEKAVKGMLPKNKIGSTMYRKLFVYAGEKHPHATQTPKPFKL